MRFYYYFALSLCALLVNARGLAAQDAIQTTHEFGVTVTADEIIDTIAEMESYWPSVRRYIASDQFKVTDLATRRAAVERLKELDDRLSARLFNDVNSLGLDMFDYLAARNRKTAIWRQLRAVVADDQRMLRLKARWDEAVKETTALPQDQRPPRMQVTVNAMRQWMHDAGIVDETIQRAMPVWDILAQSIARVDATGAGQEVLNFEEEVAAAAVKSSALTFNIIDATEWALISRPDDAVVTRKDFIAAWAALTASQRPATQAAAN